MLRRFCRHLTVSAAGRHLAGDLAREHGRGAFAILEGMTAQEADDALTHDILVRARGELEKRRDAL